MIPARWGTPRDVSCSQMTRHRHPAARSSASARRSRARFADTLRRHQAALDTGSEKCSAWSAKSGRPGSERSFRRKSSLSRITASATRSSGPSRSPLIRPMTLDLRALSNLSTAASLAHHAAV